MPKVTVTMQVTVSVTGERSPGESLEDVLSELSENIRNVPENTGETRVLAVQYKEANVVWDSYDGPSK